MLQEFGSIRPSGARYLFLAWITLSNMPSKRRKYPIHSETRTSTIGSFRVTSSILPRTSFILFSILFSLKIFGNTANCLHKSQNLLYLPYNGHGIKNNLWLVHTNNLGSTSLNSKHWQDTYKGNVGDSQFEINVNSKIIPVPHPRSKTILFFIMWLFFMMASR